MTIEDQHGLAGTTHSQETNAAKNCLTKFNRQIVDNHKQLYGMSYTIQKIEAGQTNILVTTVLRIQSAAHDPVTPGSGVL